MISPSQTPDEERRLDALRQCDVMDTGREQAFDDLASLAAQICGTPMGFISLIDKDRAWVKSGIGFEGGELPRDLAFCNRTICGDDLFIVPDARTDSKFADNPLVIGEPRICFYAGMPLMTSEGMALGALGVMDRVPRQLQPEQESALRTLGRQAVAQLELRRRIRELQASEGRKSAVMNAALDCIIAMDHEGRILEFNPAAEKTFGYLAAAVIGRFVADVIIPPELREHHRMGLERYLETGEARVIGARVEITGMRADESLFPVELSVVRSPGSEPPVFLGFIRDITERKQREAEVRAGEEKLRAIFDAEPECVKLIGGDGVLHEINAAGVQMMQAESAEAVIGHSVYPFVDAAHLPAVREALEAAVRGEKRTLEFRVVGLKGRPRWIEMSAVALRDESKGKTLAVAVSRDITARKAAEEELRTHAERLRNILDRIFAFVGVFSLDGRIVEINRASLETANFRREDVMGRSFADTYWWEYSPEMQERIRQALARAAHGETVRGDFVARVANGQSIVVDVTFGPLHGPDGQIAQVVASGVDVTTARQTEKALRESEERFRQVIENIREIFWIRDVKTRQILYVSPSFEETWGQSCEAFVADPDLWMDSVHPEDRERVGAAASSQQLLGEYDEEFRIIRPDVSIRWIRARAFPVKDADGNVYRIAGVAEDTTEHKRLEEQFQQSQRMEAIGRLASAVAHDFNNLLSIMGGNAALLLSPGNDEATVAAQAQEIVNAADRATSLTRQLLLFSRKQIMQPVDLDLNTVVTNISRLLQRILGADISVRVELSPGLPFVHADPGMIEQVLLNLAVNSRDAMPSGGRLTISTALETIDGNAAQNHADATMGPCVLLSVRDTGMGIAPEIIPRIFEPFFTTKEAGKGTGLGLASVYGIVKQHRGWITVESDVNRGAVFRIYFPASARSAAEPAPVQRSAPSPGTGEIILLVEDEASVRLMVASALTRNGYQVLQAVSGAAALDVWREHQDSIALLLTDMVMPEGISGSELAERLTAEKPDLKVIYTSGYSTELSGSLLNLQEGVNFLQKPYKLRMLIETVRNRLDQS